MTYFTAAVSFADIATGVLAGVLFSVAACGVWLGLESRNKKRLARDREAASLNEELAVRTEMEESSQYRAAELFQINVSLEQENKLRAALEKNLRQALEAENAAIDEQASFTRMVSHEFRTPLAVIDAAAHSIGSSQIAQHPPVQRRVARINSAVERLSGLITDCLEEGAMASGDYAGNHTIFDVRDSIRNACVSYSDLQAGRIVMQTTPNEIAVTGDDALITVALSNLVENALKYSTPHTDVVVTCRTERGWVNIDVENQGDEISEADAEKIFDRYYRGQIEADESFLRDPQRFASSNAMPLELQGDTRKAPDSAIENTGGHQSGVGLGLYLARQIARAHHGNVSLLPRAGNRTVMRLSLPMSAGAT